MNNSNELIQYIIINKDLDMSPGKVAAQVGHVCTICACEATVNKNKNFLKWIEHDQKKIVLTAHQKVLEKLEKDYYSIRDIGCNEVEPNSLTAVSLGIMTREQAASIVKRLQIYK